MRLQQDDTCVEANKRWMPKPNTYAAAAVTVLEVLVDPFLAHDEYSAIWNMVTRFWHRNCD